jgi:hypothetical protein
MICGLVSPKSIGLINTEDINQLLNKSKLMFEISTFLTIGTGFVTFWTSGIALIMKSSFSLYLIEFLLSPLMLTFAYFCANINFSNDLFLYYLPVFEVKIKKC